MKGKLVNLRTYAGTPGFCPGGVSKTVPDETYTIRELFLRYARGTMPSIGRPVFEGVEDADFDDIDQEKLMREDIVDQREIVEMVQLRAKEAAKRKAARDARLAQKQAELAAKMAEKEQPLPPSGGTK